MPWYSQRGGMHMGAQRKLLQVCLLLAITQGALAAVTISVAHDSGATSAAGNKYTDGNSVMYLLEGAVVKYTVTFASDAAEVIYSSLVVTADGATPTTTTCGPSLTVPATGTTVSCEFEQLVTAGQVTAGSMVSLAVEALEGGTSIATATLSRSNINIYKTALTLALDAATCTSVPTAPDGLLTCASGITLQNTGTVPLSNAAFSSSPGSVIDCSPALTSIAAASTVTCTLTQTATLADFEASGVSLAVSASATEPKASTTVSTSQQTALIPLTPIKEVSWAFVRTDTNTISAVGATAAFKVTLENKGNVKWSAGGALEFTPALAGVVCSAVTPMASYSDPATGDFGTSHILLVGHKVECTGSFSFTQAVYEAISGNTKSFTAALPASKPAGWAYKDAGAATSLSQQLDVTATVTRMLGATIGTCTKPTSAASGVPVSCPVAITNNGNVALSSLSLVGAPAGYSLTCADTTALIPAAVRTCTLDRTVNQNDFDAGTVTISAEYITATPAGTDTGAAVTGSTNTAPVALDQTPALSVQVTLDKPTISQKDELVTAAITVENTGNIRVTSITISSDPVTWSSFVCTGSGAATITSIDPAASTTCTATYTVNLATYEAAAATSNQVSTSIEATSASLLSPGYSTAAVNIATSYTASAAVSIGTCTLPATEVDDIVCPFTVLNSGKVGLTGVAVSSADTDITFTGCSAIALIEPGVSVTTDCVLHKAVSQTQFDDREALATSATELSVVLDVAATSRVAGVTVTKSTPAATAPALALPITRTMTVQTSLSTSTVNAAGQSVVHTVTVQNTGNSQLRAVGIATTLTAAGVGGTVNTLPAYSCSINSGAAFTLASPSTTTLPHAGSMTCTATYAFDTVATIEAGDLAFATSVTADQASAVSGPTRTVTVQQLPAISVSLADPTCASGTPSPDNFEGATISCASALVISAASSNVRVEIGSILPTAGTLGTCSPALTAPFTLDPSGTASVTCSITSPALLQDDIEAGSVAWDVHVGSVLAAGSNATVNGAYTASFTKALTRTRTYQLGIKRVPVAPATDMPTVTTADTAVKLQVQLLNLGNTILKGVVVALPEVSGLTCKTGTTATPDADVLTSGTAVSAAIDVSPKNKVVCEGTYTFLQAELDVDQTAKAFTPTLTTTSTGTSMDNAALPADSYTASASIPLGAAASLVLTVDAANCVKPTIIPAGQTSVSITCPMTITNSGHLTLQNVVAVIAAGNAYLSTDCGTTALLAPTDAPKACTLTATANQNDFDAGTLLLAVSSIATPKGPAGGSVGGTLAYSSSITLNNAASMDLVVSAAGTIAQADDIATYTITASNTGAVRLHNLVLVLPAWATLDSCTPAGPGPWTIETHSTLVCTAHYAFTQAVYEAGAWDFVAQATPTELATVSSVTATVTPTYTASAAVSIGTCTLPATEVDDIVCPFTVLNSGKVGLTGVAVSSADTDITFTGCSAIALIEPGVSVTTDCVLHKAVSQTQFDDREALATSATELSVVLDVAATSRVPGVTVTKSTPAATAPALALPITRTMTVQTSLSTSTVNAAGGSVDHTVVITNTGNSQLRGVTITTTLSTQRAPQPSALGAYSCTSADINSGVAFTLDSPSITTLPHAASMTCTATYTFDTVDKIEAGDLTFATSATATSYGTPVAGASRTVTVPSLPAFDVVLNGGAACAVEAPLPTNFADSTISCAGTITASVAGSNVRVDIGSFAVNGVTVSGCSAPTTLDPTAGGPSSITCGIQTRALTQDDFEAGSMSWTVTASGVAAKGGNSSINANYPVTLTHTLVSQPKYQLGIKRVVHNGDDPTAAVVTADTTVKLQVQLVNTGNRILRGVQLPVSPALTGVLCKTDLETVADAALGADFTLGSGLSPGHKVVCTGTYTFTQAVLDATAANSLAFTPSLTITPALNPAETRDDSGRTVDYLDTASIAIASAPALVVSVDTAACSIPTIIPAGATDVSVTCPMTLHNSGQLTLTTLVVTSSASSYVSTDCGTTATLAPGLNKSCILTATAVQNDYDAGTLLLPVAATGGFSGYQSQTLGGTLSHSPSINLNNSASMDLVVSITQGTVSAAGNTATYTITARNTGAVRLHNVALTLPTWAVTDSCTLNGAATIATHSFVECTAHYTFDQDTYENGPLDFVASAAVSELPSGVTSAPATITPSYSAVLMYNPGTCTMPTAPGDISCPLGVTNSGTVRLTGVQLTGPKNSCPIVSLLVPAEASTPCNVLMAVIQSDFDTQEADSGASLTLPVNAVATPNVTTPLAISTPATQFAGLKLPIDRLMTATATLSAASVAATGDSVTYTVVVTNTGNVKLRGVTITTTLTTAGPTPVPSGLTAFSCSSPAINTGTAFTLGVAGTDLLHAAVLTCTATYTWSTVETIEAGDLAFASAVTATSYGSTIAVGPDTVTVPSTPQLAFTLDQALCDAASPTPNRADSTITCVGALTLSAVGSNVRVTVGSVVPTSGATITGCTPAALSGSVTLDPTVASGRHSSITCSLVSAPLLQSDFEAGILTWGATAGTITSFGGTATTPLDPSYSVTYTKQLTLERKYSLGIKRVGLNATDPMEDILWADTPIKLQVRLVNLGNTILQGAVPDVPLVSDLACKSGLDTATDADVTASGTPMVDAASWDVGPGKKAVCVGSYTFLQTELDVNQVAKAFTASATPTTAIAGAITLDNAAMSDGYAASTPGASINIDSAPALVVTVNASACNIPTIILSGDTTAAITCPMQLKNTGQVTLTAVHALTDAPLSTDCSTTATLAPGAVTSCVLTATAVQDDYDAGTLQLVVNATSGHMGSATHVLSGTLSYSSSISLNDSASMDVAVVATPSGVNIAGAVVTYAITASNTGPVRLKNTVLTVPPWATITTCTPALPATIETYSALQCTATYTFDQDFLEAGPLSFVAAAKPAELPVAVESAAAVVVPSYTASLDYVLGACTLPLSSPGDAMCGVGITNTGKVRLKSVQLQGPKNNCTMISVLGPTETIAACTLHRTVTQAEFDTQEANAAATITLPFTAIATPNVTTTLTIAEAEFIGLQVVINRVLTATAQLNATSVNGAGQSVVHTVTISNTGNSRLRGVDIATTPSRASTAGSALSAYTCTGGGAASLPTTLEVASTMTCTATYTFEDVTDIEAGDISFSSTVSATDMTPAVAATPNSVPLTVVSQPSVQLVLNATTCDAPDTAGGTMTCTDGLVFTNTGNVCASFTGVTSVSSAVAAGCLVTDLLPGASHTCTFTQPMSQLFLEAGVATATLTVNGVSARGTAAPLAASMSQTIHPAVTQIKTLTYTFERTDVQGPVATNDTVIDLKATLVNTGNVRLRQLAWTHDWSATYTWTSCSLGAAGALAPSVDLVPDIPVGQQLECVGTYTVTQAIMEEGAAKAISAVVALKVTDALAALPLPGGAVTVVSIPVTITPELTVTVLDTSCVKPFRAGGTATCPVVLKNTGNMRVTGVSVVGDTNTCTKALMLPDETLHCEMSRQLVQNDYEQGFFTLSATDISGVANGPTVLPKVAGIVSDTAQPILTDVWAKTLTVSLAVNASQVHWAGDTARYTITAVNDGNVILYDIAATAATLAELTSSVTCVPSGTLAVAATMTCTGTFTFDQPTFEAGVKSLTAALQSANLTVAASSNTVQTTPVEDPKVAISINLPSCTLPSDAGLPVTCDVLMVNTGNVRLSTITSVGFNGGTGCAVLPTGLAPGAQHTCSMSYNVPQTEFDAWDEFGTLVALAASVSANPTGQLTAAVTHATTSSVALVSTPSFAVSGTVATPSTVTTAGTVVTHDFVLTNDGNVALRTLSVVGADLAAVTCTLGGSPVANPVPRLTVGASISCTGTFTFTQTNIEAGDASHTTQGTSVNTNPATTAAFTQQIPLAAVTVPNNPVLEAYIHYGSPACNMPAIEPDALVCVDGAEVKNMGNVRLSGVSISGDVNCSMTAGQLLAPGASFLCTITRPTIQDDFEASQLQLNIAGTATALGVNPSITALRPTATETQTITQAPSMTVSIVTVGGVTSVSAAGTNVTFLLTAQNTGNLILQASELSSTSTELGTLTCTPAQPHAIPVRGKLECTAQSNFDQDDMEGGQQTYEASGTSTTLPAGAQTVLASPQVVQVLESPQLVVDVVGAECTKPLRMPGNVTCRVQLTNAGNMRLADTSVLGDENDCVFALLWPSDVVSCNMTRALVQTEFEGGTAAIQATSVETTPLGIQKSVLDNVAQANDIATVVLLPQTPQLDMRIVSDVAFVRAATDVVTYTVTATNTGSLRLTNLAITIPTVTNLVCSYGADNTTINTALTSSVVLELDAVVQCVGTYTFTQDDIESPPKVVAATATSTTVKGAHTFTSNDVSVTALNAPSLRVDILTADCIKPLRAPEILTCPVYMVNLGNVRLTNVRITGQPSCLKDVIEPAGEYTCNTTLASTQAQFEAAQMVVTFAAEALPRGSNTTITASDLTDTDTVLLVQSRNLSIEAYSEPTTVTYSGSRVNYTYIITNPGNVMVRNISISAPGVAPLTCNGTSSAAGSPPIANMSVYERVICEGSFTFNQPTIELGDKTVQALVTANTLTQEPTVPAVLVTVPNTPKLQTIMLNSSCDIPVAAGGFMTCNLTCLNTGNVRLTNISVGGDAVTCGLNSPSLLSPGANISCVLRRLTVQDDFEAGSLDLLYPLNASALGTVSQLQAPLPAALINVRVPQLPALEVVTTIDPTFVTWPGDLVTYTVSLHNRGNVHLRSTDVATRTNSSTTGMNTTFPVDCGGVSLPTTILVGSSLTCVRTIEFTTPVIRAGNMTVFIASSATNLPLPVSGFPRVVNTPTCENRSVPVPAPNCLNVSKHCPNDVDYLCDKTDLNRKWCTCWGGVTECVTLGVCRYTPCKTCQVCLSWAALQTPQLFNLTNAGLVAAEVNTRCKGWGKTSAACQTAADAVALSEAGNSGKRGGQLCSLMQECVNPAGFEPTCNLGNSTTVPGSSPAAPYVPRGNLSLCAAQGTNTGRVIPGGLVVPAGTNLTAGACRTTPDCNSTDLMCSFTSTNRRCVCNEATGIDACEEIGSCGPTPCAICKRCFVAMQGVAVSQQSVTNATAVALAVKTACLSAGRSLETCSMLAIKVEGTFQGSMGKRPALLCRELAECPETLDPTCVLIPNATLDQPAITSAALDTCSLSGLFNGSIVPETFALGAPIPDGSCTSSQPCTTDGFRCSYSRGAKFCTCLQGADSCIPLGECYETTCTTCQDCITKANTFVAAQLQRKDAATIAAAWKSFCGSQLTRATAADCALTEAAIAASPYGNLGKRAATLCSWVKSCSSDMGPSCVLNALVSGAPYTAAINLCTVEGVDAASRVPGVSLTDALPPGACHADFQCNSADLMCDITTSTGDICVCDPLSGADTCTKHSGCVRTPCAVCSDCLTQMAAFTTGQLYVQDSSRIAAAFSTFCNATKLWTAAQCSSAASLVAASKPSFGKRAGNLCQALGRCGATGAPVLGAGCMLKVSTPATATSAAATFPPAPLDLCAVEGLSSGTDVPGTTRKLSLPTGTCDSTDDCVAIHPETMCIKTLQTPLCTCSDGLESCRVIGGCADTPCKSCKRCLQDFSPFVNDAGRMALTGTDLADAFRAACVSTGREGAVCDMARLSVASSFRGNAARRAGAICKLLSECDSTAVAACSLTDGTLTGSFSLCTREGIAGGSALTSYPIDNITKPAATCAADSDCNVAGGEFCNKAEPSSACACSASTGADGCTPLGVCRPTPCTRCQQCISNMQSTVRTTLINASPGRPSTIDIVGAFDPTCEGFAAAGGYSTSVCQFIVSTYVMAAGSSGYFGLRPGAICSSLGQCSALPADCRLRTTAGAPLLNATGGLDVCSAEGIAGGSALGGVVTLSDPPGLCLNDTICAKTNTQCDTMNKTQVMRCAGGLDTSSSYGRCVPKPLPPPELTPCERCSRCLTAARVLVSATSASTTATPTALSSDFYSWCSGRGYALASCRSVQASITTSMSGNLARRAGALCQRLEECHASVASDLTCGLAVSGTGNSSSPVSGRLDLCTVEGVSGGQPVAGLGASSNNTCVLDTDCASGKLCSSDTTVTVCRCMGGMGGCDELSTCQPKPTPPSPSPAPVPLSPCEACRQCITSMQAFVTPLRYSSDAAASAAAFVKQCTASYMPGDVLGCRAIGESIAYSLEGNLAKRAGALCARIGGCSALLQGNPTGCSISLPGLSMGTVDLCTAEGVTSGSTITPPASALPAGTCTSDKDCSFAGAPICSLANPTTRCTCAGGNDTCVVLGQCVDFCSTKAAAVAAANAMVLDCDPTSAARQCPTGLECKATSACKKLACDWQGVQTRQCYGLCTPAERSLVGAQLSDDGTAIRVALNAAAAPASFACISAFDTSKIGQDAWCIVSGRELVIILGKRSVLVPQQDSLALLSNQTVLYDMLDAAALFKGSKQVAMCSNCGAPEAAITGPTVVPEPCDPSKAADITFDASFSRDGSGRPLAKYQWAQVGSNDMVLAAAVSTANAADGGAGSSRLTLPASGLENMADQAYMLQVTVSNYLGISSTSSVTFSKVAAGQAPVVMVAGGTRQTFKISEGLKLTTQLLATSVCSGKKVEYLWQSLDTAGWSAIPDGYKRKDLVIRLPLSGLAPGDVRVVRLTANFKNSASKAIVDVTLTAEGSPLQAVLRGPSGSIRGDRIIVLNASQSIDPDDPTGNAPLIVNWECVRADYPTPCFTGTASGEQSGLVWKLDASLLAASMAHTFKVTVSKVTGATVRSASASLSLTPLPVASKSPTGRVVRQCSGATCAKTHNADAPLALTLVPDAGYEAATVSWQSDQLAGIDLGTSPDLRIPPTKLPSTGALVVNAVLKLATGETSTTQMTVGMNGKPFCSLSKCLVVNTVSDTFPAATFAVEAVGFMDDQEGGLRFEFGKVTADGLRDVMASGKAPTATLTGLSLTTTAVYVCAVDVEGAKACEDAAVAIKQPPQEFKVADALTSFDVGQLSGAGDISVMAAGAQTLSSLSAFAQSSSGVAASGGQASEEAKQVQTAIAAKTGAMINSLASSAATLIDDPQTMSQVVAAVATLSKATQQLSSDAKGKMLAVVESSITCAKVNKQQVTADEATRMWAVVAAGNGVKSSGAATAVSSSAGSSRHLLSQQQLQPEVKGAETCGTGAATAAGSSAGCQDQAAAASESYWEGSNDSRYQLFGPTTRHLLADSTDYVAPTFLTTAAAVAQLLAGAASPGSGFLSGGDNGLYVSVANQLGRSYAAGSSVAVGPVLTGTGGAADATSASNAVVGFSKALTSSCRAEDGSVQAGTTCSNVPVSVTLTYLPDASPLLSSTATRAADAAPLPAGFTVVSGALLIEASGLSTGALPCDSCVARLTVPITESASSSYSYLCAHVVTGQVYLDAAVVTPGTASGAVVECSISQAGSYVVGRVLAPSLDPALGVPITDNTGTSGQRAAAGVPAIVGGVVGGVVGAVVVAAAALFVVKRRRMSTVQNRSVAVAPLPYPAEQQEDSDRLSQPENEDNNYRAALPAGADEEGGESGMTPLQWAKIREEARRTEEMRRSHDSPRASHAGAAGQQVAAAAVTAGGAGSARATVDGHYNRPGSSNLGPRLSSHLGPSESTGPTAAAAAVVRVSADHHVLAGSAGGPEGAAGGAHVSTADAAKPPRSSVAEVLAVGHRLSVDSSRPPQHNSNQQDSQLILGASSPLGGGSGGAINNRPASGSVLPPSAPSAAGGASGSPSGAGARPHSHLGVGAPSARVGSPAALRHTDGGGVSPLPSLGGDVLPGSIEAATSVGGGAGGSADAGTAARPSSVQQGSAAGTAADAAAGAGGESGGTGPASGADAVARVTRDSVKNAWGE